MTQSDNQQSPRQAFGVRPDDVTVRLQDELEQMRVLLEDAHSEAAALASENAALRRVTGELETKCREADANAVRARNEAARCADLVSKWQREEPKKQELQAALEEVSLLAEELREANDGLLAVNNELEQRVAARTAELNEANATLELLNTGLGERLEAETEARSKAQAELFQMQKLEAIGQLTGGIAHDFNNLLTVITSGLELLGHPRDDAHRDRLLSQVREAAWRGAHLTQRLLAFARRQPLHPERLELREHMESLRLLLSHALRENIEMQLDVAEDVWPVETDIAALELALLNLAVNARAAMPGGGTVVLAARNEPVAVGPDTRLNLEPGSYVRISLIDDGSGMGPELLDRVFEPFFSTKPGGKGTGLGLAQVYGFARQSGGDALIDSTVGSGTAVHMLLPRSLRPPPAPVPRDQAPDVTRSDERLRILVVEDDDSVASIVVDMLERLGHASTRVATVVAALAALACERFHVVFSDVLLPGGESGLDLAREIRRRDIDVRVILTSGFGGGVTQRLAAANLPFLRKPYRLEALRSALGSAPQPKETLEGARLPGMAVRR